MKNQRLLADINDGKTGIVDEVVEEMATKGRLLPSPEAVKVFEDGKHIGWK